MEEQNGTYHPVGQLLNKSGHFLTVGIVTHDPTLADNILIRVFMHAADGTLEPVSELALSPASLPRTIALLQEAHRRYSIGASRQPTKE